MHIARGTFEVKLIPPGQDDESHSMGRLTIDKEFQGDLTAISKGQMLSFRSGVQGSAGYVAMERVEGSLEGRRGSFVLQHSGTMTRGEPQLSVSVVPDSGTDELVGLAGKMAINIIDGRHDYEFEYTLPEAD